MELLLLLLLWFGSVSRMLTSCCLILSLLLLRFGIFFAAPWQKNRPALWVVDLVCWDSKRTNCLLVGALVSSLPKDSHEWLVFPVCVRNALVCLTSTRFGCELRLTDGTAAWMLNQPT